jgi:antitoxin component YwqK of YwqJK toxin-antitoxin module
MKNIALKRAVGNTHILPHGIFETYYHKTKTIEFRKTYKNGIINGLFEHWYSSGKLYKKYNYKNGELNGLQIEYHLNCKLTKKQIIKIKKKMDYWNCGM